MPPRCHKEGTKPTALENEGDHNQLDNEGCRLAVKTPEGPFLEAYFINLYIHTVIIIT